MKKQTKHQLLREDRKKQKKVEQVREEERILKMLEESYEKSELLFIEDIKDAAGVLFKVGTEKYQEKNDFLQSYIENVNFNTHQLRIGKISVEEYLKNHDEYYRVYNLYTDIIQEKINKLHLQARYLLILIGQCLKEDEKNRRQVEMITQRNIDINDLNIICDFKGFCQKCIKQAWEPEYCVKRDFCDHCESCNTLRKESNKPAKATTVAFVKDAVPSTDGPLAPIQNIIEPVIEKVELVKQFLFTYDRYFSVKLFTHGTNIDEQIHRLKFIFTNLMCGISGKFIFPNEPKHSESKTYPVVAAIYFIEIENALPILHGLIRYQDPKPKSHVTIKQLQKYNQAASPSHDNINEINMINLWEGKKRHISLTALDVVVKFISKQEFHGSDINDFYID